MMESSNINDEFLLQCISNFKPLYDKSDKGYKSILQKENCWASVAKSLGCTVAEVKSRFKTLREKYRREVQVTEKLERSGAPSSTRPVWPLMSLFKFMYKCGQESQRSTTSNIFEPEESGPSNPESQTGLDDEDFEYEPYILSATSSSQPNTPVAIQNERRFHFEEADIPHQLSEPTTSSMPTTNTPVSKRKRISGGESVQLNPQKIREIDDVLVGVSAAINNMNNTKKDSSDRYDLFGQFIASELKHLGEPHSEILKEEIQVILINYKRQLRDNISTQ